MRAVVVTGSSGLIGSEVCAFFDAEGFRVHGVDNNQRAEFFGPGGDTTWNRDRLCRTLRNFQPHALDVRDRAAVRELVRATRPVAIIHAAAQPSHDLAARIPFVDFEVNALGTLNLLEAAREYCRESPFLYMSTNKVYGDRPNTIALEEQATRWEYAGAEFAHGIPETFPVDQATHSLFGASKLAADVMVQEYGRYFGMPTCCLRGGCLTGPQHAGVELHGFLSYLVKCNLEGREYRIYGYKGKQVRDNLHAADVANFMYAFFQQPRVGEVYNLGGGKTNSCSILEAFRIVEGITGKQQAAVYDERHRTGDHICYYSDLRKLKAHYPAWEVRVGLTEIVEGIVRTWQARGGVNPSR